MFSLVIAVISVLLVAALALAVIYYGGSAFSDGEASAQASRLINQGQQVLGAAELFKSEKGRWPDSVAELVSEHYLKSVPTASMVSSAWAQDSATWVMPVARVPVFKLQQAVAQPVCQNVNFKTRGDNGILKVPVSSAATQCYGEATSSYTVVVAKTAEDLNGVEGNTLPAVPDEQSQDWAVKPSEVQAATPQSPSASSPAEEKGGDNNVEVYFQPNALPVTPEQSRTVVYRFQNLRDEPVYVGLDLTGLNYDEALQYQGVSSTCPMSAYDPSVAMALVPANAGCTLTVSASWGNPVLQAGVHARTAQVMYTNMDYSLNGIASVAAPVSYSSDRASPQQAGSCTEYGQLKVCAPYVGELSDGRDRGAGTVTIQNNGEVSAYYRYTNWGNGFGRSPEGDVVAYMANQAPADCDVVDSGYQSDWVYWVVEVPPSTTCSIKSTMRLDGNATLADWGIGSLASGGTLLAGWAWGEFAYGADPVTLIYPETPPALSATIGDIAGNVRLEQVSDADRHDSSFTFMVWSNGNKTMTGSLDFAPQGSYLLTGPVTLKSVTGSCVNGTTVQIPAGYANRCALTVAVNYTFNQAYPTSEQYATLGTLSVQRSDGKSAQTSFYATQPAGSPPAYELSYEDAFGLFGNSAGCSGSCMAPVYHTCEIGSQGIVQCGSQYAVPVNLTANYVMDAYEAACMNRGSADGSNSCQVSILSSQTGKNCKMTNILLSGGNRQYAIICR